MAWLELQLVGVPRKGIAALSRRLFALGTTGVQEDFLPGEAPPPQQPWDTGPPPPLPPRALLRAWFEDPDTHAIDAALSDLPAERHWAEVQEEDWANAWRARFQPVRISPTLVVAPPWDAPEGALIIEPGQGFGTGQHPTTRQILSLLEPLAAQGGVASALDIGCGSGVLALAAARLGVRVHGVDVEPEAVADAIRNAERNAPLPAEATFDTTAVAELLEPADVVLANLHGELLVALASDLRRLTGTHLLTAGILDDREPAVREAFASFELVQRIQEDRWVSLHFQRRVP